MAPNVGCVDVSKESGSSGISMLFVGLLTGALVGGIAALLLAPKSGRETREMIKERAMETQHMVQDKVSNVTGKVSQIREHMKSRAEQEAQAVENRKI